MTRITALINQKGGVGKTTAAINLAYALATEHAQRVLMIDLDQQANLTLATGTDPQLPGIVNLLLRDDALPDAITTSLWNVAGLDLIPADIDLAQTERDLERQMRRETILQRKLAGLLDQYDHIILDCPSTLGLMTINALTAATDVIIPCLPNPMDARGAVLCRQTINSVRDALNTDLNLLGILFSQWQGFKGHDEVRRSLRKAGFDFLKTRIGKSVELAAASAEGSPLDLYRRSHPINHQFRALARELIAA